MGQYHPCLPACPIGLNRNSIVGFLWPVFVWISSFCLPNIISATIVTNPKATYFQKWENIYCLPNSIRPINQNEDSISDDVYRIHSCFVTSENLQLQLKELSKLHPGYSQIILPPSPYRNNSTSSLKKRFKIVHIGDSHIQSDILSDAIRQQFQKQFGNAGTGYLFPYSLARSYGPRGISARTTGTWIEYKTMTPNADRGLGITGYGLTSYTPNACIYIDFTDKFKSLPYQRLKILHSTDSTSFEVAAHQIPAGNGADFGYLPLPLIKSENFNSTPARSWGQTTFEFRHSEGTPHPLKLEFLPKNPLQNHTDFYGFQLETTNNSGVEYQSYGVVGSQFTHFIQKAGYSLEQLKMLQPNIIIFSFGTNEAYNSKLVLAEYYVNIDKFLDSLQKLLPSTAIILTSCQDTRSNGKIPPKQQDINFVLKELAYQNNYAFFDLNRAMGGWNSIYRWQSAGLTLKDKVHFNNTGYTLQGKMIAAALLEEYNQVSNLPIDIDSLNSEIDYYAVKLNLKNPSIPNQTELELTSDSSNSINSATSQSTKNKSAVNSKSKTSSPISTNIPSKFITHTVKPGENLYRIASKYHTSVDAIAKRNNIKNPTAIKPGQKLIIPRK